MPVRASLKATSPTLSREAEAVVGSWLRSLQSRLAQDGNHTFRPKQINDPVWGNIDLMPWEVALLDTPLLQRLRGVRQLGLAHLVFPSAGHSRLEHSIGIVGAVEAAIQALSQHISRWNRDNKDRTLPQIEEKDRFALRLAALLHDVGHGPFSHAIEPVLHRESPFAALNAGSADWRAELYALQSQLKSIYDLNKIPSVSEVVAVAMIATDAMYQVLSSDKLFTERARSTEELIDIIIAAIIGGVTGPGATHLSALISSQVDSDKLDYLSRDAHHSGLEIGFDTKRLLSRLEVLHVREDNVEASAAELRQRAASSPSKSFHQIGIAASGFGSFEQMLIGRTFLYDRLYHHHKVRAAEAMAQRLILLAERDRGARLSFSEVFLNVEDDTMLRVFAQDVEHKSLATSSKSSSRLSSAILNRDLFHRAYAFRGRFIASPPGQSPDEAEQNRGALWRRIVKDLDGLGPRFEMGQKIFDMTRRCAEALSSLPDLQDEMRRNLEQLNDSGPEEIIVDLPGRNADAIRLLARYPTGTLKVPEFSFNPVKWSDAYELQKRTGYVFCQKNLVYLVSIASKIIFLSEFGVTMTEDADGYIKTPIAIPGNWLSALVEHKIVDRSASEYLSSRRYSLLAVKAEDLKVPDSWIAQDPDFADQLALNINKSLQGGLNASHLKALGDALSAAFAFVDTWFQSGLVTQVLPDEDTLQARLRDCFRHRGLKVDEGSRLGGGFLDLSVEDVVLVENKFRGITVNPDAVSNAAEMQGRRYAIALGSQVVIVVSAYQPSVGKFPNKTELVKVESIRKSDQNRVGIRFSVPYGAVVPSDEKSEKADPATSPPG